MHTLTAEAFRILVQDLERHGNELSEMHRAALLELVDTLTDYAEGATQGRKAFAMPTGMGKTSAVAAFVAALHKIGHAASVAVSASKVEALCRLKQDFVRLGVPVGRIGLKHSLSAATEPSTGSTSFPYQLVTHVRVRSGRDFDLFGRHEGRPRALMVYDETLFRSDALAVDAMALRSALGALGPIAESGAPGSILMLAQGFLEECSAVIQDVLTELRKRKDPTGYGREVQLPSRESLEIDGYIAAIRRSRLPLTYAENLEDLLRISQNPLRVLATSQTDGALWCTEAIPRELRNVIILDASQPIRTLATMDTSIEQVRSFEIDWLKTFEDVKIVQLVAGGGRDSIQRAALTNEREKSALSLEVIEMVRENWETCRGILIFTFKKRSQDIVGQLRRDLRHAGFDTTSTGPNGQPRIQFLTWGDETSLNGYEYCDVVIMAGVLQQSFLNVAAEIRGQVGDLGVPTPHDLLHDTVESEVAHLIYQGASRGSCRRVYNGKAKPMKLYFVHRNLGIRKRLDQVMPGSQWEVRQPIHLKAAKASHVASELAAQLLAYLREQPKQVEKVSSKKIKAALKVADDEGTKKAFTRAVQQVTQYGDCGWASDGRSLVRINFAHHFGRDPS